MGMGLLISVTYFAVGSEDSVQLGQGGQSDIHIFPKGAFATLRDGYCVYSFCMRVVSLYFTICD